MTARELLELNGDFRNSPLLQTVRKLHVLLSRHDAAYVIIGGLAVVRNGAIRTTGDVDVLVRKEEWPRIQQAILADFTVQDDSAVDRSTNVNVAFLFVGDDWDMIIPLADPNR